MSFLGLEDEKKTAGGLTTAPEEIRAEQFAVSKQADAILALSVISMLFCCIGGIISTYFAYQGKQDAKAGNILGAEHSLKIAKGWMIATFIIGILGIIGKLSEGVRR